MTPLQFLELLWQYKPEELYVLIWTLQDKKSHWHREVVAAAEVVLRSRGMDVYVGVGLAANDYGPAHRCTSDEIAGITALWADLDLKSYAHTKALPPTLKDAMTILPASFPPTIVIETGNGAHAWWLLKEPYIFEGAADRKDAATTVARWHTMLRYNSAQKGWAFDRLPDLARLLRIPGTRNHKDGTSPKDVVVHSFTDRRYNLSDFAEYVDDLAIPDPVAQESAARDWAERFADKPLVINVCAEIEQAKLDAWMDPANSDRSIAMRFRNTWFRQRHDLKDQSQSGYDLALACFGMDAGLEEQQIVDMVIHHRRMHRERQRTRLDYFQRTIAKAAFKVGGADPMKPGAAPLIIMPGPVPTPQAPASAPAPAAPAAAGPVPVEPAGVAPPPETQKGILLDEISRRLGLPLVRIAKITGKEPTYQLELESGQCIEFSSFAKFIDQGCFRNAIGSIINRLVPKMQQKAWEQFVQMMLDALVEEEGGEENDFKDATLLWIQQYLAETALIPTIESQNVQNARKPMVHNGAITICASDFQVYLTRACFQNISVKAVASMLRAIGAVHARVRGRKFREQSRWLLPANHFDPMEYSQPHQEDHVYA